jgi:hypothetical protein
MNENLQKIKDLVAQSNIPEDEKVELIAIFSREHDSDLEDTARLFAEDPSWIQQVSDNYKSKRVAMIMGEETLWQKILDEEESLLAQLKE